MLKRQLIKLKKILNSVTMESASFSPIDNSNHFIQVPYTVTFNNPNEFDLFIKSHIKLYFDTYVELPLNELISEEEVKIQGKNLW